MKKTILTLALLAFSAVGFAQTNLVTNGDFEAGDDGSWTGNAVNIVTEGGNSFNLADVETAGNAFDVNISSTVTLIPGAAYTLTFDASSSGAGRTMVVGIGQSAAPFFAAIETVTLTDQTQTFTVSLTATDGNSGNDFGDATSRVLFDMGADTGVVVIDNVKLVEGSPEPVANLLTNGDFEVAGDSSWYGNAFNVVTEGGNSFNFADVEVAGNAFDVNLSQLTNLIAGADYKLTFDASSSGAGRTVVVGIGQSGAPFFAAVETITLTDQNQTFTVNVSATDGNGGGDFGGAATRVIFDMGADTGIVVLDNVVLAEVGATEPVGDNLLTNGDFEVAGDSSWYGNAFNVVTEGGNSFNFADVEVAGNAFDVNLSQLTNLTAGADYKLTFDASSSGAGRTIVVGIGQSEAPFFAAVETITLTDQNQSFTVNVPATDGNGGGDFGGPATRVIFDMGADTGVVVLDNVVLVEAGATEPGGDELVTNGDFETAGDSTWYGNAFNVVTEGENSFNFADVEVAGNAFDVNLSQLVNLEAGAAYTLTFDASSSGAGRSMVVGIGQSGAPFFAAVETITLTDQNQTFTVNVSAVDGNGGGDFGGPASRVIFDMGADTGIVVLDNVSLKAAGSGGGSGATMPGVAAPTPPERNAADVISLFSDAYTDINVETFSAGFDDSDVEDVTIEGNATKKYTFTNFAGIEFLNDRQDLTNMTHFHLDFWVSDTQDLVGKVFNHKLSNWAGGEGEANAIELSINTGTTPAITAGAWVSIDVPLDSFNGINGDGREDIAQYIISSNGLTIFIDNIYFYRGDAGGAGEELLTNGDFEAGDDGSWIGNALNILEEGGNSFNFADVATAGDAFAVNLSQVVEITPSETYTFSFDAGSSGDGRTMVVGIGLNEAPFSANVETITLADTIATYSFDLAAINDVDGTPFGIANSRVIFDMGADTGVVVIDNVSLTVAEGVSNEEEEVNIPTEMVLQQNFPNPFNPSTNIQFSIPQSGEVKLEIFNITGQRVATLVDGFKTAGEHVATFNASNLASGLYIYRLVSGNSSQVRKMLLIK